MLAETYGFCFGVDRAVKIVEKELVKKGEIVTLGPLIHNPGFVEELANRGIKQVSSLEGVKKSRVIIRSHGAEKSIYKELEERKITYIDATCKIVLKSQEIVRALADKNIFTVIIGDPEHSEIKSLKSFARKDNFLVTLKKEELSSIKRKEIGIMAQTTLSQEFFKEFISYAKDLFNEVQVYNTICSATNKRQNAARKMAKQASIVIVVGGRNSSNTKKLFELCKSIQENSFHIESCLELKETWFKKDDVVGITSGDSTPDEQVDKVILFLKNIDPSIDWNISDK